MASTTSTREPARHAKGAPASQGGRFAAQRSGRQAGALAPESTGVPRPRNMPAGPLPASSTVPTFRFLRDTARVLRSPQSTVARNWLNTPAMTKYSPRSGMSRPEFDRALYVLRRMAAGAGN